MTENLGLWLCKWQSSSWCILTNFLLTASESSGQKLRDTAVNKKQRAKGSKRAIRIDEYYGRRATTLLEEPRIVLQHKCNTQVSPHISDTTRERERERFKAKVLELILIKEQEIYFLFFETSPLGRLPSFLVYHSRFILSHNHLLEAVVIELLESSSSSEFSSSSSRRKNILAELKL